jgi:hypothetical protein
MYIRFSDYGEPNSDRSPSILRIPIAIALLRILRTLRIQAVLRVGFRWEQGKPKEIPAFAMRIFDFTNIGGLPNATASFLGNLSFYEISFFRNVLF